MPDNEREGRFDVVRNKKGELMFCVKARAGEVEAPQLLYDGGDAALLIRRRGQSVFLDDLHPESKVLLKKARQVLFAEIEDNDLVREYMVQVNKVRKLPL